MFDRILVPVDFSKGNRECIAHAARMAGKGSVVTLIHVIEEIDHLHDDEDREFYTRLIALAEAKMQDLLSYGQELGVNMQPEIVVGKRAFQIINIARDRDASVIVMNSRRMDLDQPMRGFGGTSHTVAVYAQCPVFLVK